MTYGFSSDLWVFGYGTGSSGVDLSSIIDDALSGCGYSSDRYEAAQLLGGSQKFALDGTCVDEWPTTAVSRTIRGGVATTFDGVNQSFNTGYTPTSTGSFTVGIWLKTAASADLSNEGILTCNITSTSGWRLYGFSSTVMRFQVSGGSTANRSFGINYNNILNDGQWHLLVVTYDTSAGNVKAYVDGALKQTISGTVDTFVQPTRTIKVGSNSAANGDYFTGQLQLPAVWEGTAADADLAFKWHQQEYADVTKPSVAWLLNGPSMQILTADTGDSITAYNSPTQYANQDVPVAWLDRFGYETKSSVDVPALYDTNGVSTTHTSDNATSSNLGEARSDAKLVQATATKFSATNQIMKGSIDVTGQSQFTVSFWSDFSSDATAGDPYYIGLWGSSSSNRQFIVGMGNTGSRLKATVYSDNSSNRWDLNGGAETAITRDKWQQVTVVFDKDASAGEKIKLYIDGVDTGSLQSTTGTPTTLDNTTDPTDFAIGTLAGGIAAYHSEAKFQLPAVWVGTALTDAQVLSNYNLELDDVPTPTAMWHLDADNGYNVISNSNHLTATNSPTAATQDRVHWNIAKGFTTSSGNKIPALLDGSSDANGNEIGSPAQVGHNGAESKIDFTNGGSFYWLDELYEGAGDFDGSSSWVDLDHNLLDTSEDFTIELEFNADTVSGSDCILQFATASTDRVSVCREGTSLRIQRYDGVSHGAMWNVSTGTWYTLKITWDATAGDWSEKLLNDSAPTGTNAAVSTSSGALFMAVGSGANGAVVGSVGLFDGKIRRLKITQGTVKIDMPLISNALDFSGSNNHGTASDVTFPTITASSAWAHGTAMTCPQSWDSTDGDSFVILKPKAPTQKTSGGGGGGGGGGMGSP